MLYYLGSTTSQVNARPLSIAWIALWYFICPLRRTRKPKSQQLILKLLVPNYSHATHILRICPNNYCNQNFYTSRVAKISRPLYISHYVAKFFPWPLNETNDVLLLRCKTRVLDTQPEH